MVQLIVRPATVEGEVWEIPVDHEDTLQTLCDRLEGVTGREADKMYLFHERKGLLEKEKTFQDYNVRPESVLDLLLRFGGSDPLGGMPVPDPVPWYNDPIPQYLMDKYRPDKNALAETELQELEAKYARLMSL